MRQTLHRYRMFEPRSTDVSYGVHADIGSQIVGGGTSGECLKQIENKKER